MSAERGFVALLAAVSVALVAMGALLAVDAASGTSASVRRALERFDEETALASLESDAAFLLLTEPIGPRSILVGGDIGSEAIAPDGSLAARAASGKAIFEVRLDGRPYEREGRRLCIQDEAGLLNLNTQDEGALARLIAEIDPDNAERLAGAMADYTDEDDARRLNGAEGGDYPARGRAGPANRPLQTIFGAYDVLFWDRFMADGGKRLLGWTRTAAYDAHFNPNTAPKAVLKAAFALQERDAEAIVQRRETTLLLADSDLPGPAAAASGQMQFPLAYTPARSFIITIGSADFSGRAYRVRLSIPEGDDARPYRASERIVPPLEDAICGLGDSDDAYALPESSHSLSGRYGRTAADRRW